MATDSCLLGSITVPHTLDLEFVVLPHPRSSSLPVIILGDVSLSNALTHWHPLPGNERTCAVVRSELTTELREVVRALSLHAPSSVEVLRLTSRSRNATLLPPTPERCNYFRPDLRRYIWSRISHNHHHYHHHKLLSSMTKSAGSRFVPGCRC